MAIVRFNDEEKHDVRIVKCLLMLFENWKRELKKLDALTIKNDKVKRRIGLLKRQVKYIEMLINKSDLSEEEMNIINDTLINKRNSIEYIGRKYYYSESGLRNKVNIIVKKILTELYK